MNYPKGTTKEQWDQYEKDCVKHNKFIEDYKFFLTRICRHLEQFGQNKWTPREIMSYMTSEIDMAESMDAPNKPGYYRANND